MQKKTSSIEQAIRELIEEKPEKLINQQHVIEYLKAEKGFIVTQSTLSRYFRKLGVIKANGLYRILSKEEERHMPAGRVLSITPAPPNIMVMKTLPGHGSSIAAEIDAQIQKKEVNTINHIIYEGVLGTVAGDDTVLLILAIENKDKPNIMIRTYNHLREYYL